MCSREHTQGLLKQKCLYSDSQAVITPPSTARATLNWSGISHSFLVKMAYHKTSQMIWLSDYTRAEAMALLENCQLARTESKCPFIGPEPTCDISAGISRKTVTE
jgi:hypothetical protein